MSKSCLDKYYRCKSFLGAYGWEVRRPYGGKSWGHYHIYARGMSQADAFAFARMKNREELSWINASR